MGMWEGNTLDVSISDAEGVLERLRLLLATGLDWVCPRQTLKFEEQRLAHETMLLPRIGYCRTCRAGRCGAC